MALTISPVTPPQGGGMSGAPVQAGMTAGPSQGLTPAPGQTRATGPAATDPAYAAYLRAMGVQESQINSTAAYRVGALQRSITRQAPIWAQQTKEAGQNVDQSFESNGMLNSGFRLQKRTDATNDIAQKRLAWEGDVRDQMGGEYIQSAQDIADLRRSAAEQALTAAQNTAIANAQAGIF